MNWYKEHKQEWNGIIQNASTTLRRSMAMIEKDAFGDQTSDG